MIQRAQSSVAGTTIANQNVQTVKNTTVQSTFTLPDYFAAQFATPDLEQQLRYDFEAMRDGFTDNSRNEEDNARMNAIYDAAIQLFDSVKEPRQLPDVQINSDKVRFYDIAKTVFASQTVIQSDGMFFDLVSDPDSLAQATENIAAWYSAWVINIDNSAGDIPGSHLLFTSLIEFLSRMGLAVCDAEVEKAVGKCAAVKTLDSLNKQLADAKDYNALLDRFNVALNKSNEALAESTAEIKRLQDLYEPATPATEGGANE
ncbi:hypothetical protein [Larkinella punicea]|uniref:Uncharacterized protein n=1 Tax=Larkinella punicea TaxID=2315727 RepID=A0A368JLY4_9BACT|nr:hypothetical protein [Larkinella punicea]RCR68305.1 hypothetical protein DUE52_18085 [Larkinella punicea]